MAYKRQVHCIIHYVKDHKQNNKLTFTRQRRIGRIHQCSFVTNRIELSIKRCLHNH